MFINNQDLSFKEIKGNFVGELGRDTYKGMNATLADLDNNGFEDIYVSNVHVALQAEGSMLWLNNGKVDENGYRAFHDGAVGQNILNENRFGWGAAAADINADGYLDVLQVNGMVNNNYDPIHKGCPDYWYWNEKIALTGPEIHGYAAAYADLRGRCIYPHDKKRMYLNKGSYFVDIADKIGWTDHEVARGVATADFDNDGDLDVVVTQPFAPLAIYKNNSKNLRWVGIELKGNGTTCNRDAIGTRVYLLDKDDQVKQMQEVKGSNGLLAQSDRRLYFGLKSYEEQAKVKIAVSWCGQKKQYYNLIQNQYTTIEEK
ncbi:MAG: CRTAC1 family protein [Pseudobacteriovorax sp.]|nr:CRTAC1 family protein [Pseudobacteriovorax sp.]